MTLHIGFTDINPSVIRSHIEILNALFPISLDVSNIVEHKIETRTKGTVTEHSKKFSVYTNNTIYQGPFFGNDKLFHLELVELLDSLYIRLYPEDHKYRFSCRFSEVCFDEFKDIDSLFALLRSYYANLSFGYPIALINNICHQYKLPAYQYQADSYSARISVRTANIMLEFKDDGSGDVYFKGTKIATKGDLIPLAALIVSALESSGYSNQFKTFNIPNFSLFDINDYENSIIYNEYLSRFKKLVSLTDSELTKTLDCEGVENVEAVETVKSNKVVKFLTRLFNKFK